MSVYLNRMKNATLFTLRVWKSDGRWEIAVACDSAVTTHPVVIPLPCVHHDPRQERVGLPVHRVTLWATITSHATTDTLAILKVFKLVREGAVGKPVKMKQNIFHPYFLSEARPHLQLGFDRAREGSNVLYLYDTLMTLRLYLYSMLGRSRQSEPGRWGIFEILAWTRLESFRQMWSRQTCSIDPSSNPQSLNETKQIYSRLSQKQTKLLYKCKKNVTVCNNDENKLEMAWPINDFRLKSGRKWPMNNRYLK